MGKSFYQKRIPAGAPDWLQSTTVSTPNGTTSNELVVADIAHVLWAVNIGCLGLHLWPYLAADPADADELRIDLDPTTGIGFDEVRAVALLCRDVLDELGLRSYPKTTGNNGLHVYLRLEALGLGRGAHRRRRAGGGSTPVPGPHHGELVEGRARQPGLHRLQPERPPQDGLRRVVRPAPDGRAGLDPPLLGGGRTVVPNDLTIRTVPDLVRRRGDPWADIAARPQSIEPLLALAGRDKEAGLHDVPWPPQYPKMPDEPPGWPRAGPRRRSRWSRSTPSTGSPSCSSAAAPTPTRCAPFARGARRGGHGCRHARRAGAGRAAANHRRRREVDHAGHRRGARGQGPDRLTQLEESPDDIELDTPAQELLGSLHGDCHSHSDWSDGGSPIREMAEAARDLGHDYLVLTDHSARLTVAHGLDAERLRAQLDVLADLNEDLAPFRILTGIEVDILEDGSLDQELDLLAELDVVVASVHSKLRMESPAMTERMLAAVESPHTDILGHCTGRLITGRGRAQSTFDAEAVFSACARTGPRWRSTRGPSARTHPRTCCARPWPSAAPSPSTPTPTRQASSAGSAAAAPRRSTPRCRPSASSTAPRSTTSSPGPGRMRADPT